MADAGFVVADTADDGGKERVGWDRRIAKGGWVEVQSMMALA